MDTKRRFYVITLTRPWAWAVIYGGKDVENRDWRPREPVGLLIHAGREYDWEAEKWLTSQGLTVPEPRDQPARVIIGKVHASTFRRGDSSSRFAAYGRWNWELTDPEPAVHPIDWRGVPGLRPAPQGWERAFIRGRIR